MPRVSYTTKLQKIIGQIRFRPTLSSFDKMASTAAKLESEFKEWVAPKSDTIALFSPQDKKFLELKCDMVTYTNEKTGDTNELIKYISAVFNDVVTELSIKEIRRMGFRNTKVLSSIFSYKDLTDLIYRKFYSANATLKEISGPSPKEVVFVLDSFKNGFSNHIHIGSVNKMEGVKFFNSSFKPLEFLDSDDNLYVDVDVFAREDLKPENAVELFTKAVIENKRIFDSYMGYIEDNK